MNSVNLMCIMPKDKRRRNKSYLLVYRKHRKSDIGYMTEVPQPQGPLIWRLDTATWKPGTPYIATTDPL